MKATSNFHLVQKLKMREAMLTL